MVTRTGASFVGLPAELVGPAATAEPASKTPYVIAAVVATLVLAAGAVFGILAVTDRMAPAPRGVHALPPAAPSSAGPTEAAPAAPPLDPASEVEEIRAHGDGAPVRNDRPDGR